MILKHSFISSNLSSTKFCPIKNFWKFQRKLVIEYAFTDKIILKLSLLENSQKCTSSQDQFPNITKSFTIKLTEKIRNYYQYNIQIILGFKKLQTLILVWHQRKLSGNIQKCLETILTNDIIMKKMHYKNWCGNGNQKLQCIY